MKEFNDTDIEAFAERYAEYSTDLFPKYLDHILKLARKNFKERHKHIIMMKRRDLWTEEDVKQAFYYNDHNFKIIKELRVMIKYFETFIEFTESSGADFYVRSKRIRFSKQCIQKTHRLIAIYKATIMTA